MQIKSMLKNKRKVFLVLILSIFFIGGFLIGLFSNIKIKKEINLSNKENALIQADFGPFWKAWQILDEKYPNAKNTSDQDRVYGAISGLVSSLDDPYSVFFDPEETEIFEEDISGNFSGVGMEIGLKKGVLTVIAPLKDTPAYKAGIESGDKILQIEDTLTTDFTTEEAVNKIRGEKGTPVNLTILRKGETTPRKITITRDIINVPTIETEKEGDIFIVRLFSFTGNSHKEFRDAIKSFAESGTDKLILDLRGNPGGYLSSAVSMSSWFLPTGKVIVTEDYGEKQKSNVYRSEGYDVFSDNLKFAILIDEGSASASEILAGAMQDYEKAILVGKQSYGKGSVQEVVNITKDTILKITVANWLTPSGHSLSETGLTPDYEVSFDSEKYKNENIDTQLEKAKELLNNM